MRDGHDRRAGRQPRRHLPPRIERKPVLARVIQLVERDAVAVPIDEALARAAQPRILHAETRIDVQRACDAVHIWAEAGWIEGEPEGGGGGGGGEGLWNSRSGPQ